MTAAARLKIDGEPELALAGPSTIVGRDPSCDLCLAMQAVSRQHARIDKTAHGYSITDLDSRNGTFVNGQRLGRGPAPLRDGDEIVVAGAATLHFIDPIATPIAPAIGRLSGVWIDPETRAVWVDAQPIEPPLSARQQVLLELLAAHEGELVSRDVVIDHVWADVAADGVSAEAIDALVKRLRARLRERQLGGDYLQIVRGRGMRLSEGEP